MIRDLTMIVAVLVSLLSVGFGIYQKIDANNAKGFAHEQVYQVIGKIQEANVSAQAKASMTDAALGVVSLPPSVIDLSRSSADTPSVQACTEAQKSQCASLANDLANANATCTKAKTPVAQCATDIKSSIIAQQCYLCYTH